MRGHGSQWISHKINIRHLGVRTVEKIKILGAVLELPSKQHCQSSPSTSKLGQIGQIGSAACGKFFWGVGGFLKILRNSQGGSWQMLTSAYKVGGWGKKRLKMCLRNIWMVPKFIGKFRNRKKSDYNGLSCCCFEWK